MFDWRRKEEWWQLFRYYQAGVVNVLFGYAVFALLIWLGMQVYGAQLLGHVIGVVFNYFTYSRYAFAGQQSSKASFAMSYVGNYFLGLAALWGALQLVPSPYMAGLMATVAVSVINFFILKRLVFKMPGSGIESPQ
jgi:putative flippase GtrA